jgi:hypothetical protein
MKHSRTFRPAALALVVAATAVLLAACGSSSNTGSSSATSSGAAAASAGGASSGAGGSSAARSKFVACLKAHGVTLHARPAGARQRPPGGYGEGGAPGFFFGGGAGGASGKGTGGAPPGRSRFANPKFRAALQACGGGQFRQRRAILNHAAVTKFAACVKQHGYNLPAPNFSGKGPIFPANIARHKQFQAAAKACASDLRPPGPRAAGAGGAPPGGRSSSD